MSRLQLAQVTLCAVDTARPALAAQAMLRTLQHLQVARAFLFTSAWLPPVVLPGIEIVDIEPIHTTADRGRFVIRQLPAYIRSSHMLLVHWDGFVVWPQAWLDEFLVYDYIGAGLATDAPGADSGFSLRSRRYMAAGLDPRIAGESTDDDTLCGSHRSFLQDVHGVMFAPPPLLQRFADTDDESAGQALGFCGARHLPSALPEQELTLWLAALPADFLTTPEARRLTRALLSQGMPRAAQVLLERRRAAGCDDADMPLLGVAAGLLKAFGPSAR